MYQEPTYSKIPGGLNARQVDLDFINSESKFREAILKPTTTFFEPFNCVFACTLADKIKLVRWMKEEHNKFAGMVIFWPGKYQSHAFYVLRRRGAMTKIMELLGPSEDDKARIAQEIRVGEIRKLKAELRGVNSRLDELEASKVNKPKANVFGNARDSYPYDDWKLY